MRQIPTPQLTRVLEKAIEAHQPPLVNGRRIKLRYAHQGGRNPPRIVIHGSQTHAVPDAYQRYLSNVFREAFDLYASPVVLEFRSDANPYDRRQMRKSVMKPDIVDRGTTKGKTGGKSKAAAATRTTYTAAAKAKTTAKRKAKAATREETRRKVPKPGSSRSGKDNRRGPRVKAAAGKANPNKRR